MKHANRSLAKRLLIFLAAAALVVAAVVMALNVYADPFGVFGDRFLNWWGYDEALSPKVAKLSYLRQHHEEYDAYLVGASDNGTYPMERLNDYFDASFYDLRADDGDMKDVEAMSRYVVEQYSVKHLVLSSSLSDAAAYDMQNDRLGGMSCNTAHNNPLLFYGTYLLASPRYALDKLREYQNRTYLQSGWTGPGTGSARRTSAGGRKRPGICGLPKGGLLQNGAAVGKAAGDSGISLWQMLGAVGKRPAGDGHLGNGDH